MIPSQIHHLENSPYRRRHERKKASARPRTRLYYRRTSISHRVSPNSCNLQSTPCTSAVSQHFQPGPRIITLDTTNTDINIHPPSALFLSPSQTPAKRIPPNFLIPFHPSPLPPRPHISLPLLIRSLLYSPSFALHQPIFEVTSMTSLGITMASCQLDGIGR